MTRRSLVLSVALFAAVMAPVATPRADTPPTANLRTVAIDDWRADGARQAAAATTWHESAPLPAGDAVLVGADWGGDDDVAVQVRAATDGTWSGWQDLEVTDEHVPDPNSGEGRAARSTASEPVWVGRADELQFRVQGDPGALDAQLVDVPGDLDYDPEAVAPANSAVAATERPLIRPRASWGADESLRDGRIDYADDVRFSIVHHVQRGGIWDTEDIKNGCRSAAAKIRGIYEYHVKARGYWDIAYNFVVDPCGGIWEGRYGGIEEPVVGAHAAGWNYAAVGVLALGAFEPSSTRPADPVTDEMVAGIEELLAWKLDVHHVDPSGEMTDVSGCTNCSSRWPEGTEATLPVLSAHQIQNNTECPGEGVMAELFQGRGAGATPTDAYVRGVTTLGTPKAFGGLAAEWEAEETGDRPTWDVTFTEEVDWSLRIRDGDGDLVRATGGLGERAASRTWDLRDADGHLVDAGDYTAELSARGADGDIRPIVTDLTVSPGIVRHAGEHRVATAVSLSEWAFEAADTVVVASAAAYPDALVASPLAGSYGGPVLLTARDELPDEVAEEIERLGASTVLVAGGSAAVAEPVVDELEELGVTVERLAGSDRFATAAKVAERIAEREGSTEVLVALGAHEDASRAFPDALAAGAFGAELTLPVVLAAQDGLPDASAKALSGLAPDDVRIFGGTAAISADTEQEVARAAPLAAVERFAGTDRFDTAVQAAEELLRRRGEPVEWTPPEDGSEPEPTLEIVLASGLNWPDALGAGAAAAATDSLFLMAPGRRLDHALPTRDFMKANRERIRAAYVAGGSAAVHGDVVDALAAFVTSPADVEPEEWPADPRPAEIGPHPSEGTTATTTSGAPAPSESPTASPSPSPSETTSASPSPSESTSDPTASSGGQ